MEDVSVQTHCPCVVALGLEGIREVLPSGIRLPPCEGLGTDDLVSVKTFAVHMGDGRSHLQGLTVLMGTYPEFSHGDIGTGTDLHLIEDGRIVRFVVKKDSVLMKKFREISGIVVGEQIRHCPAEIPHEP